VNPLRRLYYLLEYAAATSLLGILAAAPLRLTLAVGDVIARIAFLLMFKRRGYAIDNLLRSGITDSPREARRIAFASFRTFVAMVAEANAARRRITDRNWREHVTMKISPEAEKILADPKQGVLVASAHFGNWEVVGRAASMLKPLTAIYRPFNNPYLDRAAHAGRTGDRLRLISKFDANPMRFVQTLARGEVLGIMIDQYAGREGVPVQFFGRQAWTTKTVAMLHLTTRCPLLLVFALRTGPLQYEVHVLGPLQHERTGDRERDVFAITQNLTREIEKVVRAHPEQYMWGHRRWKQPKSDNQAPANQA
jgi:Kdo2-lipid IVA lauroyltransferase/acyltransferase